MKDLGLEGLGRELGLLIFSVLGVLACLLGEGVRVAWAEGGREGVGEVFIGEWVEGYIRISLDG